jgi:hypothetical protein
VDEVEWWSSSMMSAISIETMLIRAFNTQKLARRDAFGDHT